MIFLHLPFAPIVDVALELLLQVEEGLFVFFQAFAQLGEVYLVVLQLILQSFLFNPQLRFGVLRSLELFSYLHKVFFQGDSLRLCFLELLNPDVFLGQPIIVSFGLHSLQLSILLVQKLDLFVHRLDLRLHYLCLVFSQGQKFSFEGFVLRSQHLLLSLHLNDFGLQASVLLLQLQVLLLLMLLLVENALLELLVLGGQGGRMLFEKMNLIDEQPDLCFKLHYFLLLLNDHGLRLVCKAFLQLIPNLLQLVGLFQLGLFLESQLVREAFVELLELFFGSLTVH